MPVAQLVEHVTFNHGVVGSNPAGHTNNIKGFQGNLEAFEVSKMPSGHKRGHNLAPGHMAERRETQRNPRILPR